MEGRASRHYKHFIDTFIFYQSLFNNSGNLSDILELPYPMYRDIILAQVKEKEREEEQLNKIMKKNKIKR